jgi:hypothetical protein
LLLVKPPAATGQSHSPAKLACPDAGARADKISKAKRFWRLKNWARRRREEEPSLPGDLCWIEIRLHCAASLRRRSIGRAVDRASARPPITSGERFTPLNLPAKDRECAKADVVQDWMAGWAAFFNEL